MGTTTPSPHLTYTFWSYRGDNVDPSGIVGDGPRLYNVHEVTASRRNGRLNAWVRGVMRKKDGTRGRHNRGLEVDVDAPQPGWLTDILVDARRRLDLA